MQPKQALHNLQSATGARAPASRRRVFPFVLLVSVLGIVAMGLSMYEWGADRETLRLLEQRKAIDIERRDSTSSVTYDRIRHGISFAEFESIARERGLKWRWDPKYSGVVLFSVASPICRPSARFRDNELSELYFGCLS